MSDDLVKFEWEVLEELAGLREHRHWGAAVGAATESLKGRGLIEDDCVVTEAGIDALIGRVGRHIELRMRRRIVARDWLRRRCRP